MMYGINLMKSSSDNTPVSYASARLKSKTENHEVDADQLIKVIRQINQLGKEAAHRSNADKDLESIAFQFGQYRAYLHASELLVGLLNKKAVF